MVMPLVKIDVADDVVRVTAPWTPQFVTAARALGGRWEDDRRVWEFEPRLERQVRNLCEQVCGTDGRPTPMVTALVEVDDFARDLWLQRGGEQLIRFGRVLVCRRGRDADVRLGHGVTVVKGGFPPDGGSQTNPRLCAEPGTTLQVFDVPVGHRDLVDRCSVADQAGYLQALREERAFLTARLAELDRVLGTES
jgi:hypothetical protein